MGLTEYSDGTFSYCGIKLTWFCVCFFLFHPELQVTAPNIFFYQGYPHYNDYILTLLKVLWLLDNLVLFGKEIKT